MKQDEVKKTIVARSSAARIREQLPDMQSDSCSKKRSVYYYGCSAGNIVVDPPDIVAIHAKASMADGEANAAVVIASRTHGPVFQPGMEGVSAVKTDDGTAIVRSIVPGGLLIGRCKYASYRWGAGFPGAAQRWAYQRPVAL